MAKMDLTGITNLRFSEHGSVKFDALDKLRGDVEVTFSDPRDVKHFMEFLADMYDVMTGQKEPAEIGYLKTA